MLKRHIFWVIIIENVVIAENCVHLTMRDILVYTNCIINQGTSHVFTNKLYMMMMLGNIARNCFIFSLKRLTASVYL